MQAALAVLLLLTLAGFALPAASSEAALEQGNRFFDRDELEPALRAYAAGYSGAGSPLDAALASNAGTCALRLGRLPEALLWFRRAEAAALTDPGVRNDLSLVRQALGAVPPEDPPAWGKASPCGCRPRAPSSPGPSWACWRSPAGLLAP